MNASPGAFRLVEYTDFPVFARYLARLDSGSDMNLYK
mgnify:CR=1 FL=1